MEVADFLIKAGADIELGCSTPLMEAAQEGHLELVKYLLAAGEQQDRRPGAAFQCFAAFKMCLSYTPVLTTLTKTNLLVLSFRGKRSCHDGYG